MKRIYLFVLSALMMLMSTSAMAQSETVKGDVNGDGVVDVADIAAVIKIMTENGDIEKKYYWYVGNGELTDPNHPMNNGIATNIDKINLTFELDKSNSLLQTATSYTDLIGKEFPFPNHFVLPTEWLDKIQIVNANNAPWSKGTIVSDLTNKYTWCWNGGTATGTFKIIAK